MTTPFKGVALVTGAAARIGSVIAKRLALDGWRVLIHYNTSHEKASRLAASIRHDGGVCEPVHADLASRHGVESLISSCLGIFGPITCLVNNAAVFEHDSIHTVTWNSFDSHIIPNLKAPLFLCREFDRHLGSDRPGYIINIIDQKITNLNPDFLSYTMSKVGLLALTEILSIAFAGRTRVCGIAPGITLRSGEQTDEEFEKAWRAAPLGRSTTPTEIAEAVGFILSSSSMTGQVIYLDGGEHLTSRGRDVAFDSSV